MFWSKFSLFILYITMLVITLKVGMSFVLNFINGKNSERIKCFTAQIFLPLNLKVDFFIVMLNFVINMFNTLVFLMLLLQR